MKSLIKLFATIFSIGFICLIVVFFTSEKMLGEAIESLSMIIAFVILTIIFIFCLIFLKKEYIIQPQNADKK